MHTYKGFLMAFIILIPPQGGYWAPSPLLPVHLVFSEQQFTQEPSIISSRAEQHYQRSISSRGSKKQTKSRR